VASKRPRQRDPPPVPRAASCAYGRPVIAMVVADHMPVAVSQHPASLVHRRRATAARR
jgi:hypothetical protein